MGNKELKVGDKICCGGITREIKEIISQDYWGDKVEGKNIDWGYYVEFIGTTGGYGYWKQQYDGGYVIRKENK